MQTFLGIVFLCIAMFHVAIKLWLVHTSARLTQRSNGVDLWDAAVIPPAFVMSGIYCIDDSSRAFRLDAATYVISGLALMGLLYVTCLLFRAHGRKQR